MTTLGARTLFVKEVRRFMKVPGQTIGAPLLTTALYLGVFGYALGGRMREVAGVPYLDFIVPGLITLGVVSNSFLNTASSVMIMKMQGTMVDILVAPLTHVEIAGAMIGAAALRGLAVGALTFLSAVALGATGAVAHPVYALAFFALTAVVFGALGLFSGIWAEKFEHLNVLPTFVITPLTFLGGVFYDVRTLPGALATVSRWNPILYLVEGMRYGVTGHRAVDPGLALAVLAAAAVIAVGSCVAALKSGWRLRG